MKRAYTWEELTGRTISPSEAMQDAVSRKQTPEQFARAYLREIIPHWRRDGDWTSADMFTAAVRCMVAEMEDAKRDLAYRGGFCVHYRPLRDELHKGCANCLLFFKCKSQMLPEAP